MIPVSNDYIENVIAQSRLFNSRATITMDAFNQLESAKDTFFTDFSDKVYQSTVENPNIAKFSKMGTIQNPTGTWTELNQSYIGTIKALDGNPFDVYGSVNGQFDQMLFSFNVVQMFEKKYGTSFWQGATTTAEKADVLKQYFESANFKWFGYGYGAVKQYNGVRYIRDYLNGNTVNANNYWNEIQALAGGTNRASGKTPTISSGTLTNPMNVTNGNLADYAYEASGNGVAKYVQVDLGQVFTDIDTIKIVHYYADGRTFHGTKTQISSDGVNWTTLYDSAVSGEYVETSTGKSYAVPSTDNLDYNVILNFWDPTNNLWDTGNSIISSNTAITENDFDVPSSDFIGSDGFVHIHVHCNSPATSTHISELFTDYASFNMNLSFSTTRQYLDDTVVRMNIVEDISILNDAVPSNELQLTLNNSSGDFDILTFQNMLEVIASRPIIFTELGLVYDVQKGTNYLKNGSMDNFINSPTLADDWNTYGTGVTYAKTTGYKGNAQQVNVPAGIAGGVNSGYDSPSVPPNTKLYFRFLYKGTKPSYVYLMKGSGNNQHLSGTTKQLVDNPDWYEYTGSITTNNTASEPFGLLVGTDTRTTNVATTIIVDEVYLSNFDYYDQKEVTEWIPTGKYFVTEWKNDVTTKIITFTANDYFKIFSDTNYAPDATKTNLFDLATDVLTKAGVPVNDQIIDDSLRNIATNGFHDNIDSRSAVQQIAIAAQCCVYQDRYGNLCISPFTTIDKASNYLTYPTTQGRLPGPYTGGSTYPLMSTGSGMRNIDYENMYNAPEIVLEQSVYQLVIKVYDTNGNSMPDAIYTNNALNGTNGVSFTIDSKLVISVDMAQKIADWYFSETNYNAIFTINWRQNPAIECTDIVLIDEPFHSEKQSRVIHQEFDYEGYLSGVTESRGGV